MAGERKTQRKPRRVSRWIARIMLGLVAFSIFAMAVAIGFVHTSFGKNYIRERIVAELQADFPGSKIEALEGSPFGTFVLRGVTINGRDKQPTVTVDRVAVRAAILPLASKSVVVESVRVSGVSVFIREQPPAPAKPASTTKPSTPSEPSSWSIRVPDIEIEGGRVDVTTATGHEVLDEVSIRAGAWLPAGKPIAATATVRGTWRGKEITAFAAVEQDGDTTRIPIVAAQLGGASVMGYALELTDCGACTKPLITGVVSGGVPAALVKELAQQVLPGDVAFTVDARESGDVVALASAGSARIEAHAVPSWKALTARAVIAAQAGDLAVFTDGKLVGAGSVVAAVDASEKSVQGVVSIVGTVDGLPATSAVLGVAGTPTRIEVVAGVAARGDGAGTRKGAVATRGTGNVNGLADVVGNATVGAIAHVDITPAGDKVTLTDSLVVAHANDVTDARGAFDASVTASGTVWPVRDIAVRATASGTGVRREDVRVAAARAEVTARVGQTDTIANGSVTVSGIRQGTTSVASARVKASARVTEMGTTANADVAVSDARSGTTRIPSASIAAAITAEISGTLGVVLGAHRVRMADGSTFGGSGGRITVTDEAMTLDAVPTGTCHSSVPASAHVDRKTDAVKAKVKARDISLAIADPKLRGDVDADLDVTRRGGRWQGGGRVSARGAGTLDKPPLDATVELHVEGRKITLDASIENPDVGRTTLAMAVTGPRDITDVVAWQTLPRASIDHVTLTVPKLDARPLGGTGTIDGELVITGTDARGSLNARGIATKAGVLEGELTFGAPDPTSIRSQFTARVEGIAPVQGDATLVVPDRPFDPTAWIALGTRAVREGNVELKGLEITPELLERLGYQLPYRAGVDASVVVDPGAKSATLTASVRNLSGGKLTAPVEIKLQAKTAPGGTTIDANAHAGKLDVGLAARSPITVERALAKGTGGVPIDATVTIPTIAARDLLGLIGRTGVLAGSVCGTVTLAGTTTKPTVRALLTAGKLAVSPTLSGKKAPVLDKLEIDARWLGDRAELDVTGRETGDRLLAISARGTNDLRSIAASIQAANFDLEPLAAFAPGQLRGARGTLNAALTIKGLDPQTGEMRGMLQINDGRLPLSPELGTLRRATLDLQIVKHKISGTFEGRLGTGGGSIKGTVGAELVGGMPMNATLTAQVRKVQPIGAVQPQIDADVTGNFVNEGPRWTGKLVVEKGKVFVPEEAGNELLGTGAPADMIFVDSTKLVKKARHKAEKPWLLMKVILRPADVIVDQSDVNVRLVAKGKLDVEVGQGITVKGAITTETGVVDVLGRRYRLEQGVVDFDGSLDPNLDILMVHDFKNLTLTVEVHGRASDPDPRMSGDPGIYTEGQLLSFFAGAEPGNDDSATQANDAVVGGSLTILSGRIGRRLNKHLPVKFDTINYEAATSASSRAVRFGLRVSEKSYLVWRQRLEARPDENPGEIVFEYQIRPNMLFETTVGERAAGGDLLLRTRW